ncbi:MAG: ABC transporter permease [Coriobacteriia bacterium]|nr:ABC transporter permease [Coriobacteriia bacterium]MBN2839589.1 ABC transporter permease [Coriobacteriia bacterium]
MMSRIIPIATAVVADSLRRKVVYIVLVFAAFLALAIPALPSYGLGVEDAVFREVALALSFVTALVLTLSLAANRVPAEVERRTVYNVIAKGVGRWEYLVGTWLGILIVTGGAIAAFTVVEQVIALVKYRDAMWQLWQGALAVWLEMGVLAAFAVAVSAITGPVVVVTASLAALFAGHSRSTLLGGEGALGLRPFYPSLDAFNVVNPVAHGSGVPPLYIVSMLVVFLGFAAMSLAVGIALFSRRDL